MNVGKLNDWLQLAAALGVIVGLVLVAYELRQEQSLTRAELNSASMDAIDAVSRSRQQEPLARALGKSMESPLELTPAERVILDGHYKESLNLILREQLFVQRGIYEDQLEVYIFLFADHVLITEYGRLWWDAFKSKLEESLESRIESYADNWMSVEGIEYREDIMGDLRNRFEF